MLLEPVSSQYINGKTRLSLNELKWGFENGIIGAQVAVDVAASMLAEGTMSETLIALAGTTHAELGEVSRLFGALRDEPGIEPRTKWVWLLLSWVRDTSATDVQLWKRVDELYADLGYPREMEAFGPYAPAFQGKSDLEQSRKEVLQELERYLADGNVRFGKV